MEFVLLDQARLPDRFESTLDFVILYDVLVHVDLHITNKYVRELARILKPGGRAFLSVANFLSPGEPIRRSVVVLMVRCPGTKEFSLSN